VLLVEDEVPLAEMVRRGLVAEGYAVQVTHDGTVRARRRRQRPPRRRGARHHAARALGLPVLERMRAAGNWTPVLMLTAKDGEYDEADAFDLGADDYLVKPFSFVVLLARLRNLLRRAGRRAAQPSCRSARCGWTRPGTACTAATPRSP
jgi:DNA-binding response OmpR family regulator